jgi:hypothetical protein
MGVYVKLPTAVKNFIEQSLTDMIGTDVFGNECILQMPPQPTECSNCVADSIGMKSSNIYIHGGPMPFENGQICPMCHGEYIIQSQITQTIIMTVEYKFENFLDIMKKLVRYPQNTIQTRGFTADSPSVRNCISMEHKAALNIVHYQYKLLGEPILAGKLSDKFFYAVWERI